MGVPVSARAMPNRYRNVPSVYIQRRGMWRVAQGTISPQSSDASPIRK